MTVRSSETPYSDICEFRLGDRLVVTNPGSSRLYLLNESARYIWERFREDRTSEQIAQDLAAEFGIDLPTAARDTAAALASWQKSILSETSPAVALSGIESWETLRERAPEGPCSRDYVVNGRTARLALWDAGLARYFGPRLEPLLCRGHEPPPAVVIDLFPDGDLAFVFCNRRPIAAEPLDAARFSVLEQMIRIGWPETDWSAFLHAGVAASGGSCVVFPAATGSGKSTLSAALAHAGLDLLTDDMVALHGPSGATAAVPFAVQVRAGSWPVLRSRFSGIDDLPVFEATGQQIRFLPLAALRPPEATRTRAVVFTRFVAGSETESRAVSTWDALGRMDEIGFWITPFADSARAFLEWLDRIPKLQLTYSNLDEAVTFIQNLVRA